MTTRILALVALLVCAPAGASAAESPAADAAGKQAAPNASHAGKKKKKPKKADDAVPRLSEVVVSAKKPLSAASSDEIRARDYELRPHSTTQEITST